MSEELYEVFALSLRWWFTGLGLLIAVCAVFWLLRDRGAARRALRDMPDSGRLGILTVMAGNDRLPAGTELELPLEATIGSARGCDLVLPVQDVAERHLTLTYRPGFGMLVMLYPGQTCLIDGEELTAHMNARSLPVRHGSTLQIGEAVLQVRFYYGVEAERPGQLMPADGQQAQPHFEHSGTAMPVYAQPLQPEGAGVPDPAAADARYPESAENTEASGRAGRRRAAFRREPRQPLRSPAEDRQQTAPVQPRRIEIDPGWGIDEDEAPYDRRNVSRRNNDDA